ncbi:MAG: LLM class flavin-dependent oxidoreductase [Pseudonocardia sp.]|uniref:LLM class flavin-dependent oxidoreductase n=1 Tax=Pseudonocardia sp. TaxID=60912 RepID=UPI001AD50ED6|nr:LLM class flavin-dependent oxidoreductase [Pseudonocardia sp.]MBN9099258.1 LLM class flavin-dependent oxidoreductase [Pseudonocardia sp.]
MTRPFRFGVVATPDGDWTTTARRVEELGYSSLLVPDGIHLLAPFPSLATAAAVTTTLRVGTFVLASPLRTPRAAAWEAHSLSVLSGGRFDLGIGTGHGGVPHAAAELGMPYGSAAERRRQVAETIAHVRALDSSIPVLVAASGPKMLALAAELADVVTLATDPLATRDEVAALAAGLPDRVEIAMNLFVVGDEVPEWTRGFIGADAATLVAHDSLVMLRGSVAEMADELQRRRDAIGVSAITVNGRFLEQFAPVVERLDGE